MLRSPGRGAKLRPATGYGVAGYRRFRDRFEVAQETADSFSRLLILLAATSISGRQVHDANLVATMLENGIFRLLTFNARDFRRFAGMIELLPI